MTVININNISGIASVNAQSGSLELFTNAGASLLDLNANLATFPADISVGGGAIVGGALTVTGVLTYDDVTNIDSIGIVTARSGVHVTSGSVGIGTDNPINPGKLDVLQDNSRFLVREDSSQDNHLCIDSIATDNSAFDTMRIRASEIRLQNASVTNLIMTTNNRIGIGTDNPTELVTVGTALTTALFEMRPTTGGIDMNVSSGDFAPHYQTKFVLYNGQPGSGSERFKVSSEGYVTIPNQPAFSANLSSGNLNAATHNNVIIFNNEHFDRSNSYDASNGRFTAPVAGLYYFGVQIYAGFDMTGVRVLHAKFQKNGSDVASADMFGGASNHGGTYYHPTGCGHFLTDLAVNDWVAFNSGGFSGTSGNATIYAANGTRFFGYLVG